MDVPVGSIIMWYRNTSLIPSGWQLCDGTNGTPDLRGQFVVGISADADLGDPFGDEDHEHTNSSVQAAGNHVHDIAGTIGGTVSYTDVSSDSSGVNTGISPSHAHVVDFDTPASGTHIHTTDNTDPTGNLPPYVQVYYIMRLI